MAACVAAIGIERLGRVYTTFGELSTALILAVALLGHCICRARQGFRCQCDGVSFGSILTVTTAELWLIVALTVGSLAFVLYLPFLFSLLPSTRSRPGWRGSRWMD